MALWVFPKVRLPEAQAPSVDKDSDLGLYCAIG